MLKAQFIPAHDPSEHFEIKRSRVAFFEKNGVIGCIALACTEQVNLVSTFDPRMQPAQQVKHKGFETADEAQLWFTEYTIATVTENAWSLTYTGERNFG